MADRKRQKLMLNGNDSRLGRRKVGSGMIEGNLLSSNLFVIFIFYLKVAARVEGGGQENQNTPFEVIKSVISLYVYQTKWGADMLYEARGEGQSQVP